MQHYIRYGLGFSTSFLSEEEFNFIQDQITSEYGLHIEAFTEGELSREWSTLVVKSISELPNYGKMATFKEIKKTLSKEVIIDITTKEYIMAELKKYNIEHHYDKVEPIVYSACY